MITDNQIQQDDPKTLKKLLESYTQVAAHKLGRHPTLEELLQLLNEGAAGDAQEQGQQQQSPQQDQVSASKSESGPSPVFQALGILPTEGQTDTGEPDIIHTKVYHAAGAQASPDALFYELKGGQCYDCHNKTMLPSKPAWLDSLPNRPLGHNKDLVPLILHGLLSERDYSLLDKKGLLNDTCKNLWQLTKQADQYSKELEGLNKSDDSIISNSVDKLHNDDPVQNFLDRIMEASSLTMDDLNEPVLGGSDSSRGEHVEVSGTDVFSQIWNACLDKSIDRKLKEQVKAFVMEILSNEGLITDDSLISNNGKPINLDNLPMPSWASGLNLSEIPDTETEP